MKTLCLVLLLLLFCSSSGRTEGIRDVVKLSNVHNQVDTRMKLRELTGVVSAILADYRDPGSNSAHDPPGKGKSGGKGGNP